MAHGKIGGICSSHLTPLYDIKMSMLADSSPSKGVPVKLLHLIVRTLLDTFTPVITTLLADFICAIAFLIVFE